MVWIEIFLAVISPLWNLKPVVVWFYFVLKNKRSGVVHRWFLHRIKKKCSCILNILLIKCMFSVKYVFKYDKKINYDFWVTFLIVSGSCYKWKDGRFVLFIYWTCFMIFTKKKSLNKIFSLVTFKVNLILFKNEEKRKLLQILLHYY